MVEVYGPENENILTPEQEKRINKEITGINNRLQNQMLDRKYAESRQNHVIRLKLNSRLTPAARGEILKRYMEKWGDKVNIKGVSSFSRLCEESPFGRFFAVMLQPLWWFLSFTLGEKEPDFFIEFQI